MRVHSVACSPEKRGMGATRTGAAAPGASAPRQELTRTQLTRIVLSTSLGIILEW